MERIGFKLQFADQFAGAADSFLIVVVEVCWKRANLDHPKASSADAFQAVKDARAVKASRGKTDGPIAHRATSLQSRHEYASVGIHDSRVTLRANKQ